MKSKHLVLVMAMVFAGICTYGQDVKPTRAKNLTISFSPFGSRRIIVSDDNNKIRHEYKTLLDFGIGFESSLSKASWLLQLDYEHAKLDKLTNKDKIPATEKFDPDKAGDLNAFRITFLFGKTINISSGRFQIPLYIGPRIKFENAGSFNDAIFGGCLKAQFRYYVTDKIGLFVGGTGDYGWGKIKNEYSVRSITGTLDTGVVINLN